MYDPNDPQTGDEVAPYHLKEIMEWRQENYTGKAEHLDKIMCPGCGELHNASNLILDNELIDALECLHNRDYYDLQCRKCKCLFNTQIVIKIKTSIQ